MTWMTSLLTRSLTFGIIIGELELYASTREISQAVAGGLLGIVTVLYSLVGFIPIYGVYLYHVLINDLYKDLDISPTFLYSYGFALSIIWTIHGIVAIIGIILFAADRLQRMKYEM